MEKTYDINDTETLSQEELSQKKKLFRLALYAGEIMIKNGAEVYRTEDTIHRFFRSKDFFHVNAFVTPTVIILGDARYDGFSFMKNIKTRTTNLEKVALVNNFAREFVSSDMDLNTALSKLIAIDKTSSYSTNQRLICTGLSSGAFSMMLGGSYIDFILASIISILALAVTEKVSSMSSPTFLGNVISGAIISSLALTFNKLKLNTDMNIIIVGSIMPLLPGVALTNGIRDFISGDLISGSSRAFEAALIAVAIASGVGSVLSIWTYFGGVF
ncbi:MAG: threonine/serine exporter family protein [Filifactoraceae bacterium]